MHGTNSNDSFLGPFLFVVLRERRYARVRRSCLSPRQSVANCDSVVRLAPRAKDDSSIRPKGVEYVPFSLETFQLIARKLSLHGGISRVINRGDVATVLPSEVRLDQSADDAMGIHNVSFSQPNTL